MLLIENLSNEFDIRTKAYAQACFPCQILLLNFSAWLTSHPIKWGLCTQPLINHSYTIEKFVEEHCYCWILAH